MEKSYTLNYNKGTSLVNVMDNIYKTLENILMDDDEVPSGKLILTIKYLCDEEEK